MVWEERGVEWPFKPSALRKDWCCCTNFWYSVSLLTNPCHTEFIDLRVLYCTLVCFSDLISLETGLLGGNGRKMGFHVLWQSSVYPNLSRASPQHPTFIVTGWLVMLVTIGVLTSWDEWPVWRDRLYVRIEWGAGANTPTSLIFCKMSTSAVSIKNFQCHSRTSLCLKWFEKQIRRERNLSDSWQVSEECSKQFLSVTSLQPLVSSRAVTRVWQICVVLKFY